MAGTVVAPALSSKPLTVSNGIFNLFVVNPDEVETRNMRYRMTLVSEEGRRWYFDGFKVVHESPVLDVWHDTTRSTSHSTRAATPLVRRSAKASCTSSPPISPGR